MTPFNVFIHRPLCALDDGQIHFYFIPAICIIAWILLCGTCPLCVR